MSLPPGVHDPAAFIDSLWESVEVEGVPVRARVHLSEHAAPAADSGWEADVLRNTLLVTAADAPKFVADETVTVRGTEYVIRDTHPRAGSGMFYEIVLAEVTP